MVSLQDFLDYFINPTKSGYDIPKTLTYAFVLVIAIYLIFRMLRRLKVKVDGKLVLALTPYVIFGSSLRVLEDMSLLPVSPIFVTPGIYILITCVFLTVFLISLLIEKRKGVPYFKIPFIIGILLTAFTVANFKFSNLYAFFLISLFLFPWIAVFYIYKKWSPVNKIVASVQMLDATATFVTLSYFGQNTLGDIGFYEQHVVPSFLINLFGPASFLLAKIIAVVIALFIIDRFVEDKEFGNYLKLVIGILGLATGTRDTLAVVNLL